MKPKLSLFKRVIHLVSLPVFLIVLLLPLVGYTQEKIKITDVKISGNSRVEEEGIRLHVKNKAGEFYDPATVEQDVKAIYRMGFFDDVQAELSSDAVLTYAVKEKPYVREVKIDGNSQIARDKIETALGVAQRTILDRAKVSEGVDKVKKLYVEQGYVNAVIDYAVSVEANNQAVVALDISEGSRLLIKKISFEGNKAFTEEQLKYLMTTKEEWLFSFATNRGVLDRDILSNDMAILGNHYFDNGYIDHRLDDPVILRGRDGLEVVIRVDEGEQYRVGKVAIGGDLMKDGKEILKQVKITSGQIFRGSRLRDDITALSDMYSNKGYAFVQVEPLTKVNPAEKNVDITLVINQGPPVYFNRVLIAGNTKTRDKVVRRELLTTEQELFSGQRVSQSRNALQRTGYFEDVQLNTKKTDQPDTVDLQVDVKEGPTGTFSVGAGYSSGDGFIFNTSIQEKNLFGRGQSVSGNFALGTKRQDYILNFTEPYLNDTPMAFGLDAFNTKRDYSNYNERKLGFGVNTGYPLRDAYIPFIKPRKSVPTPGSDELETVAPLTMWDYMRGGVSYDLTKETIFDVQAGAPISIQDAKGSSLTSSMTPTLNYDSRDHFFNTTEGTKSSFGTTIAGLGGDNHFLKSDISMRWYYPLLKDPKWGGSYVLSLGGQLGWGVSTGSNNSNNTPVIGCNGIQEKAPNNALPLFARYFLGGINSVRGYQDHSMGPREASLITNADGTPNCKTEVVGGDKAAVVSAELLFPIMEEYGLRGVAFFDMGNAFNSFSMGDMRRTIGFGGRWMSPFGPLRVELGFPLNKKPGDETSVLGFSIGSQP